MKLMSDSKPMPPLTWQQIFDILDACPGMADFSIDRDGLPQPGREFFDNEDE